MRSWKKKLSLADRGFELQQLRLPGARLHFAHNRDLSYAFKICPGPMAREYECVLRLKQGIINWPSVHVISPSLPELANGRKIPHIYSSILKGTSLCLWTPGKHEWNDSMRLSDTIIPWTAEWLGYFEDWLYSGEWSGGGYHLKDGELVPDIAGYVADHVETYNLEEVA